MRAFFYCVYDCYVVYDVIEAGDDGWEGGGRTGPPAPVCSFYIVPQKEDSNNS